jgi:hypothetical protein
MTEFGSSLLAFIVAISVLVAVHEFGHFWVAKKLGIKVAFVQPSVAGYAFSGYSGGTTV